MMAELFPCENISIHALLAESDQSAYTVTGVCSDFYPRSPCGERQTAAGLLSPMRNFYPRSPCGERLLRRALAVAAGQGISIHALLAESDT